MGAGVRRAAGARARAGRRTRGRQAKRARDVGAGGRGGRGLGVPVRAGWACWLVSWAKLVHCALS